MMRSEVEMTVSPLSRKSNDENEERKYVLGNQTGAVTREQVIARLADLFDAVLIPHGDGGNIRVRIRMEAESPRY